MNNNTIKLNDLMELKSKIPISTIDFKSIMNKCLKFPKDIPISDWIEESIYIPSIVTANPGFVDLSLTPYLRGILDAFADPEISMITIKKPTQTGLTLSILMLLGYILDQKPGNALVVSPSKKMAEELSTERFKAILQKSPVLNKHTNASLFDMTKLTYKFDNCIFHFTWASSSTELASKAKKYLFMDEIDKYAEELKNEADPISLAMERLKTYPDSKAVFASTPTHQYNQISKKYKESNQSIYKCKCPKCETYQQLEFYQIKFSKEYKEDINRLLSEKPCYYECKECKYHITESEKSTFISTGVWESLNPQIKHHVGFHISGIMSPFMSFSDMIYQFLDAKHSMDPAKMKNFTNSILGEFYEEDMKNVAVVKEKVVLPNKNRFNVSNDAVFVVTGIDKQEDRYYYTTYEFCFNRKMNLIDYGQLRTDDEIVTKVIQKAYTSESGKLYTNKLIAMDSGYKASEVYEFCNKYKDIMIPIKGASQGSRTQFDYNMFPCFKDINDKPNKQGLHYALLQTWNYKDIFYDMVKQQKLGVYNETDDTLINMLNSEYKVFEQKQGRKIGRYAIKPGHGKSNHYLDSTVYAIFCADYLQYFGSDIFQYDKEYVKQQYDSKKENENKSKIIPKSVQDNMNIITTLLQKNNNHVIQNEDYWL